MTKSLATAAPIIAILGLSACGGGGGGNSLAALSNQFATLDADPTIASFTPDATVDALNSSATYNGVVNIGTDDPANPAGAAFYYGNLSATVDFTNASTSDNVSGSAGGFVQYFSAVASPKTGSGVPGSVTLSGALTGSNESGLGDGLAGTATGNIDGTPVAYDFDGNVTGVAGQGLILYFDGANPISAGGVGIAVR